MNPHGCQGGFPIASENARRYLKAQSVYHEVGIGPKGLELSDVYALTIIEDTGLELNHIELLPGR
jgi:hypothetical protein